MTRHRIHFERTVSLSGAFWQASVPALGVRASGTTWEGALKALLRKLEEER